MWSLNTPGKRAAVLGLLVLITAVLNLAVAGVVASFFGSSYGLAYTDALIASVGVLFVLYHWVLTLIYFPLLISYQTTQNTNNSKDFAAYVGGVIVTASIMTMTDFIWRSEKKRGYFTLQDKLNDE